MLEHKYVDSVVLVNVYDYLQYKWHRVTEYLVLRFVLLLDKDTSYKMGTGSFPEVKCGRSMLLTTHTLLVPQSWKSRAIPLPTLWATPGL